MHGAVHDGQVNSNEATAEPEFLENDRIGVSTVPAQDVRPKCRTDGRIVEMFTANSGLREPQARAFRRPIAVRLDGRGRVEPSVHGPMIVRHPRSMLSTR